MPKTTVEETAFHKVLMTYSALSVAAEHPETIGDMDGAIA